MAKTKVVERTYCPCHDGEEGTEECSFNQAGVCSCGWYLPKAEDADCTHCPLHDRPFVPGNGPTGAVKYAVVGEAPGENEWRQGAPFVGPSGRLLDNILTHQGIRREDVWTTNTVLCHPEGNATPKAAAIKACRPRLVRELRAHNPGVVLALGATATKALLGGSGSVGQLRLAPNHYSEDVDARVVPTYHPAAALRAPDYFPSILRDIARSQSVEVKWTYTKFRVVDDISTALRTLEAQIERAHKGVLVADIERHYHKEEVEDKSDPRFLCWAISHAPGAAVTYTKRVVNNPLWREAMRRAFNTDIKWGWQNGKFDIQWLWAAGIHNARVDHDTMLLHYSTDERKGTHDLEQMAVELLGAPPYKSDTRKWLPTKGMCLHHLPPNILYEYNAADADVTFRLLEHLEPESRSDGTWDLYNTLMIPAANTLARVESNGVPVDVPHLETLAIKFASQMEEMEAGLAQWVGNPRSWQQVLAALHDMGTWVENTRKETLRDVGSEFTDKMLDYRKVQKLMGTYVRGLIRRSVPVDDAKRIYASFNQQTTETGRLSSSSPNMQNIPKDKEAGIRDAIIASPGRVLLEADYQAVELRLMAEFADDPYMKQAFNEGRNFHKERAARLFGEDYSERRYVHTKNVTFASLYMGSPGYVAHLYDIDESAVKAIQRDMFRKSPTIKEYWNDTKDLIVSDSYLRSYYGRLRRFWLVTRENFKDVWKEGINFRIQSTASDLTLDSLIELEPILRGTATPIITVHDSLVLDTLEEAVPDTIATVRRVMEDTPFDVPTPAEFKVGRRWGSLQEIA